MSMLSRFATTGGGGDPYWANVSYLLVGNGVNGTTTNIKDSSSNNLATTITGNVQISTAVSPPAITNSGSGTVYFDGTNDFISVASSAPLNLAGYNWTIEFWGYCTAHTIHRHIVTKGDAFNGPCSYQCYLAPTTGYISFFNGVVVYSSTTAMPLNTWSHIAYVYNSGTLTIYLNGQSIYSSAVTITDSTSRPLNVGVYTGDTTLGYKGYLYDFRITKGVARYTANYTPPPFPPTAAMLTY